MATEDAARHAGASQQQLVRAIAASVVGTTIEWYDFFLYGTAAALVIGQLYFPKQNALTGTLLAFATYFGGFAARPVGAAIFGHYGDRVGRKFTLIVTLSLMGIATFLIGLVPTYAAIGISGAIILTILRVIQGIGVGGEWGGSVLLAIEWGHRGGRRGLIGSAPQWGVPAGLVLSIGLEALMRVIAGPQGFLQWGWRVPFLLSILLVAVGLWIRLGILETPVFSGVRQRARIEPQPVREVWKLHWNEVVLTALARTGQQAPFYIFVTFVITYGIRTLHFSSQQMLNYVLISSVISLFTIPFWGWVSDRFGRARTMLAGAVAMVVFSFPYFILLDTKIAGVVALAIAISLPIHDMQYGPLAALTAEAFTGRVRYSGSSLGYQLASITSGGPAPLIATALLEAFHSSIPIAAYMVLCAIVSIVALLLLSDGSRRDMSVEYEDQAEEAAAGTPIPTEPRPAG